jgi:hypothetical protein
MHAHIILGQHHVQDQASVTFRIFFVFRTGDVKLYILKAQSDAHNTSWYVAIALRHCKLTRALDTVPYGGTSKARSNLISVRQV